MLFTCLLIVVCSACFLIDALGIKNIATLQPEDDCPVLRMS